MAISRSLNVMMESIAPFLFEIDQRRSRARRTLAIRLTASPKGYKVEGGTFTD